MPNYDFDDVYYTLLGEMHSAHAVPGVENAYADGGECDLLYNELSEAYERLRQRLGVRDEDPDVEIILNALLRTQSILCEKMFLYGQKFHP